MKHAQAKANAGLFKPLIASTSVQSAMMVLQPGESSSDQVENEHPKAEQWLFVISGAGRARVGQKSVRLKAGSLLLIEKGERHRITASEKAPLVTLNFYSPPAYTSGGEVKRLVSR